MFFLWAALARNLHASFALTVQAAETAAATGAVMTTRLRLLGAAAVNPMRADHAELGRMTPEKVVAFSQAGAALAREWLAINRSAGETMLLVSKVMLSGRPLQPIDALRLAERGTRHATRAVGASARALGPVHRKATANARRLARKRRRRKP